MPGRGIHIYGRACARRRVLKKQVKVSASGLLFFSPRFDRNTFEEL